MLTCDLRTRALLLALCGAVAISLPGCGGSGDSSKPSDGAKRTTGSPAKYEEVTASIEAPREFAAQKSLLGGDSSAGTAESYDPAGRIIADLGFRPDADGFAFENYGNDAEPVNMRPANVESIFGNQVCAAGTGKRCVLIPSAQHWMEQQNEGMAAGHCMGFSVSALLFFSNDLRAASYGAPATIELPIQGNTRLQSLIAETFTYQNLPAVTDRIVEGTPTQVLETLIGALNRRNETYTIGILKPDGTGGHAITPFAVEDRGNGQAAILVYDNNFPGVIRAIEVDVNADTWRYVGGINPSNLDHVYEGDARTKTMLLLPTSPGARRQPCPFCPEKAKSGPDPEYAVPNRLKYIEVALRGTSENHPHLVFADEQGRRTGFVNGRLVKEIPGIKVVQNFAVQNWTVAVEPKFRLPLGHPKYTVTVDGSSLTKEDEFRITVNGAGVAFYVEEIRMEPGQQDTLVLPAKDLGLSYASGARSPRSAIVGAQFPQFDLKSSTQRNIRARLVTMFTGSVGFAPGSPVKLRLIPRTGTAVIDSAGATPLVDEASYVLSLGTTPLYDAPERAYFTGSLPLDPATGDIARFHYLRPNTAKLPVDIISTDGSERRFLVPPLKD